MAALLIDEIDRVFDLSAVALSLPAGDRVSRVPKELDSQDAE